MELAGIEEKEKLLAKANRKEFRYDLSVLLAASSLLIIIIYLGSGMPILLEALETPFSRLVSSVNGITPDEARAVYRDFIGSDTLSAVIDLIFYLLSLFLPFLFARAFLHRKPSCFYPVKAVLPKEPGKFIFFTFGFTLSMNLVCNLLLSRFYPELSSSGEASLPALIISLIMAVIIAPLCEELIFRGVIFQSLLPYGTGFAVFTSSLVFALAHRNPPQVINAFFFGICLAIGFCKTRSVTVCVLLHLVNNAFSVATGYLLIKSENELLTVIISIGVIAVISFAITAIFNAIASGKSRILFCDDYESPTPRISAMQFASSLASNFFFWFYVVIVIIGTAVLYR